MRFRLIPLLAASTLLAQQDPVIRLDVQQVLVPVVVTDKKGHHVTGLRASNFRILEDGVPQDIAAFSTDAAASVNDIQALSKSEPAPRTGPRRTFVICVDTLHTAPANAARMREALETLFEKEKPSDAQYVLIGIGRQMQVLQAATTNPLEILLKIRGTAFQGLMSGFDSSALAAQLQNLRSRMEQFCKRCACGLRSNQHTCDSEMDALKQGVDGDAERWTAPTNGMLEQFANVVGELAKLPTSRTLILVSDGFNANPKREFYSAVAAYLPNSTQFRFSEPKDLEPALAQALKVAADRNVTIYALDSRGGAAPSLTSTGPMDASASGGTGSTGSILGTNNTSRNGAGAIRAGTLQSAPGNAQANPFSSEQSATMEHLARSTGGAYFHDTTDMLKEFRSALADGREYYVLAYVPKNTPRDGKFHQIVIETTDRQWNVRAKSGYWAESSAQ
jgi:VWFA-related protein